MQRAILILVLAGTPLLAFGLASLAFYAAFACWEGCPDADLAPAIAERIAGGVPISLISAVPVAVAWILCLVQLVRVGRRGVAVALALALPLVATLSLSLFYASTKGHLLPTTWAEHNGGSGRWGFGWDARFQHSLGLLLLWPVATFAATFVLRRR